MKSPAILRVRPRGALGSPPWVVAASDGCAVRTREADLASLLDLTDPIFDGVTKMSTNENPYGAFNFTVSISGVPAADFAECVLPAVSIDAIEYRQGSDSEESVHKLPGLVRYGHLVLKRGIASSAGSLALWDWFSGFVQGNGTLATMTVTLLDRARVPVFQWAFTNAWPVKYETPVLNGKTSTLAIETLEVSVEGMKFTALGQGP